MQKTTHGDQLARISYNSIAASGNGRVLSGIHSQALEQQQGKEDQAFAT
jgi:hypothetical protein